MAETEVFKHLMEIERDAAELEQGAAREAARRVQEAHAAAQPQYRNALVEAGAKLESDLADRRKTIAAERDAILAGQQLELEQRREDREAFGRLAWRILKGGLP